MLKSHGSARSVRLIEPIQGFALVNKFRGSEIGARCTGQHFSRSVSSAPPTDRPVVRTGETIGKFNRVKANSKTIAQLQNPWIGFADV